MQNVTNNLIVQSCNVKDLLIAPTQDPFSNYDYIQSGEAALTHAIRYINPQTYKNISEIEIHLPPSAMQDTYSNQIHQILEHYFKFRLKENSKQLILFKHNTTRIFRNAVIFLIICMAIVTVIGMESFLPNLPPLMRSVLVEGFTVIGWVVMWRPIELILNQWTAFTIEKNIYHVLLKAKIKIVT